MSARDGSLWPGRTLPQIAPEILTDILARASDIAIVVADGGLVMSLLINPNNRSFGRLDHWQGRDLRDFLTPESVPKFDSKLSRAAAGGDVSGAIELNHSDNATWEFPIRYTLHPLGRDGAILMLGRDLRPIAEVQLQLAKAQLALERDHEAQREFDTRYRVLLNVTHDAVVFVAIANGRVTDLNKAAATLIGAQRESLIGASFAQEFEARRGGEVIESLIGAVDRGPAELRTRRGGREVRVSPTLFRAAGERLLVCRIDPDGASERAGDMVGEGLRGLYREGPDAIVFTGSDGIIRATNEAFLAMIEAADLASVKGRPFAEFLGRGGVDMRILTENAARAGQIRLYGTRLAGIFGAEISAEISATYLDDRARPAYAFVIRDVGRAEAVRGATGAVGMEESSRSVVDLVGSTTLKDIVAETTEVVEKMCIETAVSLTNNNRVAAAEMLGLSRQSLYVKLRKYGLLERG